MTFGTTIKVADLPKKALRWTASGEYIAALRAKSECLLEIQAADGGSVGIGAGDLVILYEQGDDDNTVILEATKIEDLERGLIRFKICGRG
jgi:hypothetical protein